MDPSTIRQIRRDLGITQPDFATLLNVGVATVRRWEKGNTRPNQLQVEMMTGIHRKVMRRREQQRIQRENAQREKRNQEFIQGLVALAAGGAFGVLLGKIFSDNGGNDGEPS